MSSQPLDLVQTLQHELTYEKLKEIITTLIEPDRLKEFLKQLDYEILANSTCRVSASNWASAKTGLSIS